MPASQRADEFAPTRDTHRHAGGQADAYTRFVVEELKPYVDRTFRTQPAAAQTALGGSSLGGLVTLHIGLAHPDVFGALAVLSPSLWWDRRAVLARVEALPGRLPWRIWLDVGTAEGRDTVRNTRALKGILQDEGVAAWHGPPLPRGPRRAAHRVGLGRTRRADAGVPLPVR